MNKSDYTTIIKVSNRFFLFNSLYGTVDEVNENIISFREEDLSINEYNFLMKRKHIQEESQIDELYEMYKKYKKEKMNIVDFIIPITNDCNMACAYCFQRSQRKYPDLSDQSWNDIKRTIEKICSEYKKTFSNVIFRIVLFGGEPLLNKNKEAIRNILLFADKNDIKFRVVTNGMNIVGYLDYLQKYRRILDNITVTVDGNRETHNNLRVLKDGSGTYEEIQKNLKLLRDRSLPYTIRVNLIDEIIDEIKNDCYDFFGNEEFHRVIKNNEVGKKCKFSDIYSLILDGNLKVDNVALNPVKYFYYLVNEEENIYPLFDYCENKNIYFFSLDGKNIYNCNEGEDARVYYGQYVKEITDVNCNNYLDNHCVNSEFFPLCGGGCKIHRVQKGKTCNYYNEIKEMVEVYIKRIIGAK